MKNMKSRGFTLIEIIVSLGIFSVVAVIAVGALVRITSANRQAQAIQSGVNNISFVLDSISREMRVGTGFSCYSGLSNFLIPNVNTFNVTNYSSYKCGGDMKSYPNDTLITFTSANTDSSGTNLTYAYLFHVSGNSSTGTTTIYKGEATTGADTVGALSFYPLTSSSINITDYHIGVYGGNSSQPNDWVFIRLKGYVGIMLKDQSVFDVQTSISERSQN